MLRGGGEAEGGQCKGADGKGNDWMIGHLWRLKSEQEHAYFQTKSNKNTER